MATTATAMKTKLTLMAIKDNDDNSDDDENIKLANTHNSSTSLFPEKGVTTRLSLSADSLNVISSLHWTGILAV